MHLLSDCHAVTMHLSCDCHAVTMHMICDCHVIIMHLSCDCHAVTMHLSCDCHVIIMHLSCDCHVIIMHLSCDSCDCAISAVLLFQPVVDHYSTYGLDGATGEVRWKHEPGDFEVEPAYYLVRTYMQCGSECDYRSPLYACNKDCARTS